MDYFNGQDNCTPFWIRLQKLVAALKWCKVTGVGKQPSFVCTVEGAVR
jgi:hypothetical protein